jgi:hypothetical protein
MRLGTSSPAEQDAAFRVVYWDLIALVKQLPEIVQQQALDKLNSTDGRAQIIKVIDDALDAADRVRVAAAKS